MHKILGPFFTFGFESDSGDDVDLEDDDPEEIILS
jgi:hypothetical protein